MNLVADNFVQKDHVVAWKILRGNKDYFYLPVSSALPFNTATKIQRWRKKAIKLFSFLDH